MWPLSRALVGAGVSHAHVKKLVHECAPCVPRSARKAWCFQHMVRGNEAEGEFES